MDIISAKLGANMAMSELAANGQIGSATKPVYTYDGDPSKAIPTALGFHAVKISDIEYDLNTVVLAKAHDSDGSIFEMTEFADFSQGPVKAIQGLRTNSEGTVTKAILCAVIDSEEASAMVGLPRGTYIFANLEGGYYVTYVEFAETVKTIDPKYLPNPADLPSGWIADLKTALGIA
jgi:hypothetical protein